MVVVLGITLITLCAFLAANLSTIVLVTLATSAATGVMIQIGSIAHQRLKEKHEKRYSNYRYRMFRMNSQGIEATVFAKLLSILQGNVGHKSVKNSFRMTHNDQNYLLIADIVCLRDKKRKTKRSMTKVRFWIDPASGLIKMFCKRAKELQKWEGVFCNDSVEYWFNGCK